MVKNSPADARDMGSMSQEDPFERELATDSSILAWRNLCTEDPDGLQSMGSQRVGHDFSAK